MPLTITPPAITPPAITPPVIELPVSIGNQSGTFPVTVPAVQPPAVQPPAITLTDAQLAAEGYVPAAPVVTTPPVVVTPPPVTTGTSWDGVYVDANGQFGEWYSPTVTPPGGMGTGGNWGVSTAATNGFTQTVGGIAADGKPALLMNVVNGVAPNYPLSIPYSAGKAGNPSPNGGGLNLAGFEFFEYTIIPDAVIPAGTFSTQLFACEGAGTYVGNGAVTQDTAFPGNMIFTNAKAYPAGVPTTEKIPLSAFGWPMVGGTALQETAATWIYKWAQQQHAGNSPGVSYALRGTGFTQT